MAKISVAIKLDGFYSYSVGFNAYLFIADGQKYKVGCHVPKPTG